MNQLKKLFESFDSRGNLSLNRSMEIIFEINYKELVFNFSKISYDESLAYDIPEQAPKKYTKFENRTYTTWFRYTDNEDELKYKVLEWLSRPAIKEGDQTTRKWYLDGINKYLETTFSESDIDNIYCRLGNAVNRTLTKLFVQSGYDMQMLEVQS